jgi:transcriptional regulator with XRE-family HTH domain
LNFSDPLEVYEALGIIRRKYGLTYKKLEEITGIHYSSIAHALELVRPASLKKYPKIYKGMYKYAKVMKQQADEIMNNSNSLLEELKNFSPREFERCESDGDSITNIK